MPWCEACSRFWTPTSMRADGSCPACGRVVADRNGGEAEVPKAPWHFKMLVAAVVVYLGWRFVQLLAMAA